jgi:alpha-L-rhamnosidase
MLTAQHWRAALLVVFGIAACAQNSQPTPPPKGPAADSGAGSKVNMPMVREGPPKPSRSSRGQPSLRPDNLRCEYYSQARGIDIPQPNLSWELVDTGQHRSQRQTAYEVRVATSQQLIDHGRPDLWDSGKVESDATVQVAYAGKPLITAEQCFWQVRVWDQDGLASPWSKPAGWTMGVMEEKDWHAQWIGPEQGPGPRQRLGIGYHAKEAKSLDETKWVQIDLGTGVPIDRLVLWPVRNHLEYALFGFPPRFKVEVSDDPDFRNAWLFVDNTASDFVCPLSGPVTFSSGEAAPMARYVRVTATRLYPRRDGVGCFALAEVEVESGGKTLGRGCKVSALDSVEAHGWTMPALTDGATPSGRSTVLMRKEVTVARKVKRATAFVSGLGQYEFTIDGRKVGNAFITPGWTQYIKTCLYDTYDVTDQLNSPPPRATGAASGVHALGLRLGTGMYDMIDDTRSAQQQRGHGAHRAYLQIDVDYTDGSYAVIVTDPTWRWRDGPTTYSGVFGGEDFDARLEPQGWDTPGFDDRKWSDAVTVKPLEPWGGSRAAAGGPPVPSSPETPTMRLAGLSRGSPPIALHGTRTPVGTSTPKENTVVYDLGQNAPYIPRLTLRGRRGTTVQLWPAEVRRPDGTIDQTTMRGGKHISYTLRGGGGADEVYWPRFWYVGSRYWQATATDPSGKPIDPAPIIQKFEGLLVYSDSTGAGTFECSDDLFNKTNDLILWAMRSNMASIITDCPHREKSGWLEQIHLNAPGLMYNFDMAPLFRKTMEDMGDAQQDDGMVPTMAPEYFIYDHGYRDSIEWGGACIYLPGYVARWYGESTLIARHYDHMSRYMAYLSTLAKDNIISTGLGDWDGFGPDKRTPVALTDTAYYYLAATTMEDFAGRLGRTEEQRKWHALAALIRDSFNKHFLDTTPTPTPTAADTDANAAPATPGGKYATGSQSCQATALDLNLVPDNLRPAAMQRLLDDIEAKDFAISCGEVGHPSLLRVLMKAGRSDLIYRIHHQSDRPGYGYQLAKGATTLTEAWDASPISHNHFMLGHIMEWFYAGLAGIRPDDPHMPDSADITHDMASPDPDAWGFKHFIIRPEPVDEITWAKATYHSIRGPISSEWHADGETFTLAVAVPPNTEATIYLPAESLDDVRESGRRLVRAEGVVSFALDQGRAVIRVGSGRYSFEAKPR